MKFKRNELRAALADYAHEAWSGWMLHLFLAQGHTNDDGTFTINVDSCDRWRRQADTEFSDLPDEEKASDYRESDRILAIIEQHIDSIAKESSDSQRAHDPLTGDPSEDRVFLEELADQLEAGLADREDVEDLARDSCSRLRSIAIGCDQLALEKKRLTKLEEQVDRRLCEWMNDWLAEPPRDSPRVQSDVRMAQVAATWLLARRTQQQGTKSMIGSALGTVGAAFLGTGFGLDRKVKTP